MKRWSLLFCLVALMAQAQVQRFIYDYKYIPNINKKDSVATDLMALDIDAKGSVYQSLNKIKADSIMREQFRNFTPGNRMNSNSDVRNLRRSVVQYKVTKEYPSFKTYLNERIGRESYKVLEDEKQEWKITPETQQIFGYKTQKATTNWGGRAWTAWFCTDIPFQDGPYKFSGLPGLIVKLEDGTGSHIMTLVANKNIVAAEKEKEEAGSANRIRFNRPEIEITETQFKKVYKTYLDDPSREMRNMMGGNAPRIRLQTPDGRDMDPKEMAKRMDKEVKESFQNNNNRIEPSLYDFK